MKNNIKELLTLWILAKLDRYGIKVIKAVTYDIADDSRDWAKG